MLEITLRAGTIQALIQPLYEMPLVGKASRVRTRILQDMEATLDEVRELARGIQEKNGTSQDDKGELIGDNVEETAKEINELSDDKYPVSEPIVGGFKELHEALESVMVVSNWALAYDELMTALEAVIETKEEEV